MSPKADEAVRLFIALFPLKGILTKEIIENSNIWDAENCIGANLLRETLEGKTTFKTQCRWHVNSGMVRFVIEDVVITAHIGCPKDMTRRLTFSPGEEITFKIIT